MRWSIKIARIAGTEVRIHITFLLFLAWIGFSYYQVGGAAAAIPGVLFVLALFGCVLLHEFGHALAARAFGIPTPDITLLPIGGVARLQRMPDKPWQELIVAIAGPLVNVVIAFALLPFLGRPAGLENIEQMEHPGVGMLPKLASVNIMLVLFNLIPAFPMDGGRVLRSLLAMTLPYGRATQIAAWIGQALAFVFGFIGLFTNPMLIFIAFFHLPRCAAGVRHGADEGSFPEFAGRRGDGDTLGEAARRMPRWKTPWKRCCAHRSTSFPWWIQASACWAC